MAHMPWKNLTTSSGDIDEAVGAPIIILGLIYLAACVIAGLVIVQRLFPELPPFIRLAGAFAAGLVLTGWTTFFAGWVASAFTGDTLAIGAPAGLLINAGIIAWGRRYLAFSALRLSPLEVLCAAGALAFSFWLMDARLSGDPLTVSSNTWGDNALHIGIARSFSKGDNYPPQFPIFSGETIR